MAYFALLFVLLNALDAFLTSLALGLGSREANPLALAYGSCVPTKTVMALGIAIIILLVGYQRLLKPLCIGMSLVVAWNCAAVWSWL